jgi:hypothetical protein
MAQFIGKLFTWFANDVIVKVLSNNRTFQRFAVKTDAHIKNQQRVITEVGEKYAKSGQEVLKTQAETLKAKAKAVESSESEFGKFLKEFKSEISDKFNDPNKKTKQ